MFDCPVDYFVDNLVFGSDKSCWAVYELVGFNYELLSDSSKIRIFNKLTNFIAMPISEVKISIIPITYDLKVHFQKLKESIDKNDVLYQTAINQADLTQKYLTQFINDNSESSDYKVVVAFKLSHSDEYEFVSEVKDAFQFFVSAIVNDLNAFLKTDTKDISQNKIKAFKKIEQKIFNEQANRMAMFPINTNMTQWLLRRNMYRGLNKDVQLFQNGLGEQWKPQKKVITLAGKEYIRPEKKDVVNLFSGVISKKGRNLIIEHEKEKSYQTFLVLTHIPEEMIFPNCEWIYALQQMNLKAEIIIHFKNTEYRRSIEKVSTQRKKADSQVQNINEAKQDAPDELFESKEHIDELEAELKSGRYPLVNASITVCVATNNLEELEENVNYITKGFKDNNFIFERPLTDQISLFMQSIISVGFCEPDFIMKMSPKLLASGMIGATAELGDETGFYVGTTGILSKPVYIDFRNAPLNNKSASATFYGDLGYGKSFNANLIVFLQVLFGAYGLIFDPKGERSHWKESLKVLDGLISIVTLSADKKFRGTLDPYNIFSDDIESATELAINILSELFKLQPKDDEYIAILEATYQMKNEKVPSMLRLAEILNNFEKEDMLYLSASKIARQIKLMRESGMAQLLFGNGTENPIKIENRLNIMQIQNLQLPAQNTKKEDYTQEENMSTVIMMVMSTFSRKFIHSHQNNFKICLFDESWMLGKTAEGEKLMSYFGRMSRSLYASMILNGHSVTDLPNEGIRNAITYKFCFHTESLEEAKRMAEYMKIDSTKENLDMFTNLDNKECVFQDLKGRTGILTFDAVFEDLISVFKTTPEDISTINTEQPNTEQPLYTFDFDDVFALEE